jgi:DNA-binding MarR family transcriptional regulator
MNLDDGPIPPVPALAGYTGYLLRRAFQKATAVGTRVMPPGRQARELAILVAIDGAGDATGLSQRRIGDLLTVNRSIMVKLVDRLEADGLVRRDRDPADRRNYALRTTERGKAMIAEMSRGAARGEAEFTAPLTAAERVRLAELLRRALPSLSTDLPERLTGLVGFLLPRAHMRVRGQVMEGLAPLGVAPQHLGILATLADIEPTSQQRLAAALGVSGPAIVAALAGLERRGLVRRPRNPEDRREHLLGLTPAGRRTLAQALSIVDEAHERLAAQVGKAELDELDGLLARIADG